MDFKPDKVVKTCSRIESGLRLGPDAVRPCVMTVFDSPVYWSAEDVPDNITKDHIVEKRKELFSKLNDDVSDIPCKSCLKVEEKEYKDVSFEKLGFIDLAHYSFCNLRCDYCGFTKTNSFHKAKYDPLPLLRQFKHEDVEFDSSVDFNGGEPSLLPNLAEYFSILRDFNIRTRLYTNAIKHRQEIEDALANGIISSLIISVDAGTRETYFLTKQRNEYDKVIENIERYAAACNSKKSGRVASKYVFTPANCSQDDINGYVQDMQKSKPQEIWLLYDFGSVKNGISSLQNQIEAYAKMYLAFLEQGILPAHFLESFLDPVIQDSRELVIQTKKRIAELGGEKARSLDLRDEATTMDMANIEKELSESVDTKFVIAPANVTTEKILSQCYHSTNKILVADRSHQKCGRKLNGSRVVHYSSLINQSFEKVIITSTYHYNSIVSEIRSYCDLSNVEIILIDHSLHVAL